MTLKYIPANELHSSKATEFSPSCWTIIPAFPIEKNKTNALIVRFSKAKTSYIFKGSFPILLFREVKILFFYHFWLPACALEADVMQHCWSTVQPIYVGHWEPDMEHAAWFLSFNGQREGTSSIVCVISGLLWAVLMLQRWGEETGRYLKWDGKMQFPTGYVFINHASLPTKPRLKKEKLPNACLSAECEPQ